VEAADLYLRQGNSILASTGAVGREFLDLLLELSPEEKHIFHDPGCESILSSLQSDILNLREPETGSAQKRKVNTDDLSIQIHSCHGPMREMEVLQDRILDMLERIPGLVPNDILVMTPDLDKYTPFIHAVFDLPRSDPRWIPFSVADRKSRDEISCLETFMKVLDLAGGRFTSTRVMEILTSPNVAMRHQLSEADLEVLENWVGSAGVRWGKDKEERRSFGLPDNEENTWKAGVERLLLGYAMPGFNQRMFKDILPYDHIEGKDAQVLGNFLVFFDQLKLHTKALEESRTLSCWADVLRNIMDGLFMEGGGKELQRLRKAVSDMAATQEIASFRDQVVDVSVIREHLGRILKEGSL
jgi:exodeoxyribonuclease V gamma subunit